MNISAQELYWLLKLDDIRETIFGLAIGAGAAAVVLFALRWVIQDIANTYHRDILEAKPARWWVRALFALSATGFLIATFIPSTAQVAAIIVMPKILNSDFAQENLSSEGRELYGLLKQYLEQQVRMANEFKSGVRNERQDGGSPEGQHREVGENRQRDGS